MGDETETASGTECEEERGDKSANDEDEVGLHLLEPDVSFEEEPEKSTAEVKDANTDKPEEAGGASDVENAKDNVTEPEALSHEPNEIVVEGEPITEDAGSIVIEEQSGNEVMDANSDKPQKAGRSTNVENAKDDNIIESEALSHEPNEIVVEGEPITQDVGSSVTEDHSGNEVKDTNTDEPLENARFTDVGNAKDDDVTEPEALSHEPNKIVVEGEAITEDAGSGMIVEHSGNEVMDADTDELKEAKRSSDVENAKDDNITEPEAQSHEPEKVVNKDTGDETCPQDSGCDFT